MLGDGVPQRIARANSLEAVYNELRGWPLIGPLMAYQLAIGPELRPIITKASQPPKKSTSTSLTCSGALSGIQWSTSSIRS